MGERRQRGRNEDWKTRKKTILIVLNHFAN